LGFEHALVRLPNGPGNLQGDWEFTWMLAALHKKVPTPSRIISLFWASTVVVKAGRLPDIAISIRGGLGDDIICGVVARELRKRGAQRVWQFTRFRDLF